MSLSASGLPTGQFGSPATDAMSRDEMMGRRLSITGTFNVRDIGGYRTIDGRSTRWKTLLRSDALHRVDDAGRALFAEYGLRTSIDLREDTERAKAPSALPSGVRLVEIPLFTAAAPGALLADRSSFTSLEDVYRCLVATRGPVLVQVIRQLVAPEALPAVVHCTAGKDRTGIVIALVLAALGVPDEVIASDYGATGLFLDATIADGYLSRVRDATQRARVSRMLACVPEWMLTVLANIRAEHGDVASYLVANGLSADELWSLQARLLEDVPEASTAPVDA